MNENEAYLKFSKPFLDATHSVFESIISTSIRIGKPEIKRGSLTSFDINSITAVTGFFNETEKYSAQLVFSWPQETYVKIASAMLMEEYREFTEEIEDIGNEISNIIIGNAKRSLVEFGYTTSMAIPSMIKGEGHLLSYPKNTTVIFFPVHCSHGDFIMEICFNKINQDNS